MNPSFLNWSLNSVYWQMMRDDIAAMGLSTFYKYVRILNLRRSKMPPRKIKHSLGIRAKKLAEILHMDITIFKPMDNTRVFIYLIVDNFSKCILGWKASLKYSAQIAFENLYEACNNHNLFNQNIQLIVDGGSENKGEVKIS